MKYIIEYESKERLGIWFRSWNRMQDGTCLGAHTFTSKRRARREARRQALNGLSYRVQEVREIQEEIPPTVRHSVPSGG